MKQRSKKGREGERRGCGAEVRRKEGGKRIERWTMLSFYMLNKVYMALVGVNKIRGIIIIIIRIRPAIQIPASIANQFNCHSVVFNTYKDTVQGKRDKRDYKSEGSHLCDRI